MNRGWKAAASASKQELIAHLNHLRFRVQHKNRIENLRELRVPNAGLERRLLVDPRAIRHKCSVRAKGSARSRLFQVGEWDQSLAAIDDLAAKDVRYVSCEEVVASSVPLRETSEYRSLVNRAEAGLGRNGMTSDGEIVAYLENIFAMYDQVRKEGRLRSAEELGLGSHHGEISCAIGRDGSLLKAEDGNHRFAIARLLGIAAPVQISAVHADLIPEIGTGGPGAFEALNRLFRDVQARYGVMARDEPAGLTTDLPNGHR